MGIVNVTPDSFSDGGRYCDPQRAVEHARALMKAGADMLDIGGESTRPGSQPVPVQEEMDRVMPVLEVLREWDVPVSVDTHKPEVMAEAVRLGADMINDVNGFRTPGAVEAVAGSAAALCIMHMKGTPQTMQDNPVYEHVVEDVRTFLLQRAKALTSAGVADNRIVLDPGFGFGKTLEHNLALLRHLDDLADTGYPILAGLSRKSMLGQLTGREVSHRVVSSVVAALLAIQRGAAIVRVHDVAETADMVKVWSAVVENRA